MRAPPTTYHIGPNNTTTLKTEVTYIDAVLHIRFGVVKSLKYDLSSSHSNLME